MQADQRPWVRSSLSRYWSQGADLLAHLPVPIAPPVSAVSLPPRVDTVALPEWAADLGIDGGLLVPSTAIVAGSGAAWERTDWWDAAAWFLDGRAERAYEREHGPIHSYSFRLSGWDARIWERAWVNRIGLFLRRWAARRASLDEAASFGPLPDADIVLTHDVDAIRKTLRIRFKQSAFDAFNAVRAMAQGRPLAAMQRVAHGVRFALSAGDYWTFARMCGMEEARGRRSIFNVYAGDASPRSAPARLLIDPSYDVRAAEVAAMLRGLVAQGWKVGLHPSFDAWSSAADIGAQKERLERAIGTPVRVCRQHWLRFSWSATWAAQEAAGLEIDTTLGFNDRPGFRNGCALQFHPLDDEGRPRRLAVLPLVLMDSQLYDYASPGGAVPQAGIARWIDEIRAVRGTATVLWHPHVLSDDYGWASGYDEVLRAVA